jgi:Flp pilus assembly secretin CpaC
MKGLDMAAKLGAQCAYVVAFASFLAVAIPTVAFAEIVIRNAPTSTLPPPVAPETCCIVDGKVVLTLGIASTLKIGKSFNTIATGDPKVVKVEPFGQSDQTVLISALTIGATNIIFFGQDNLPILNVGIVVRDPDPMPPRMYIYGQKSLSAYLVYRCDEHQCEPREGGAAGALDLPRGHYIQEITNTNINK